MKIAVVGQDVEHSAVTRVHLTASTSLLDFEVLVWLPEKFVDEVRTSKLNIKGLREFEVSQTRKISESFERRNNEVEELLNHGRTVIIAPPIDLSYQLNDIGKNEVRHITGSLPLQNVRWKHGTGTKISSNESVFRDFINANLEQLVYSAHLDYYKEEKLKPLIFIENTNKIVGFQVKREKGILLFLPRLRDKKNDESQEDFQRIGKVYIQSLIELVNFLNIKEDALVFPSWSYNYLLPKELEIQSELQDLRTQLEKLNAEISSKELEVESLQKNKLLFVGTGTPLENQVKKIFEGLGFEVQKGERGRVDLILHHQSKVAVVEIKGVKKSASETDASQLEKWVSEYNIEHKVQPKAILVANAFNEMPLNERIEDAFPHQMLSYSTKRDHCLITGTQLLGLYYHIQSHPEEKENIIQEILSTVGVFERFAELSEFIEVKNP